MASTANRHAPSEQASLDRLLDDFLTDHEQVVNWNVFAGRPTPLVPRLVFLGRGGHPLEVALASAPLGRPKVDDVRRLWAERHANRPAPLLLVVAYPDGDEARATLCGPVGDSLQSSPGWTCPRSNACAPPPCGSQVATPRSGSSPGCSTGCAPN